MFHITGDTTHVFANDLRDFLTPGSTRTVRDSNTPVQTTLPEVAPVVLARAYAPVSTGRFHFEVEADPFYSVRRLARVELGVVKCA